MNREEFCKILKECRQQSEYKVKELCFKLNTMPTDIYRMERGTNNFLLSRVIEFLNATGHTIQLHRQTHIFCVAEYYAFLEWFIATRTRSHTQRSLAEKAQCSYAAIANAERKLNIMSIDIFLKTVEALGYTITIEKKQ